MRDGGILLEFADCREGYFASFVPKMYRPSNLLQFARLRYIVQEFGL